MPLSAHACHNTMLLVQRMWQCVSDLTRNHCTLTSWNGYSDHAFPWTLVADLQTCKSVAILSEQCCEGWGVVGDGVAAPGDCAAL